MKVTFRLARKSDLSAYTDLLQRTYAETFPDPKIGLTKDCFSKEVFATPHTQAYLKSNLRRSPRQRTWLAIVKGKPVGAVTIEGKARVYDLRGFYVAPEHQGEGIGKLLWERVQGFVHDKPITLYTYAHNTGTIAVYKKWGFKIDKPRGSIWSHWPEWPKGVRAKRIYMRLNPKGKRTE